MDTRLASALERNNLVFVVGTGYSAATTDGAKFATWRGLIEDGIDRAEALGSKPGWADQVRGNVRYGFDEDDMDMVLAAASRVVSELNRSGGYAFSKWLQETVGQLDPINKDLGKRLRALPYPLLTTNYDSLLGNKDRRPTDWTRPVEMQRLLAGVDSRDVGHLHGRWDAPESVVFSEGQYAKLLESEAAQALQKAASSLKSLVYVGYGAGLKDPNFEQLIRWHRTHFIPSALDHFRLCRTSELAALRIVHANDQIIPVAYGDDYDDLPAFLDSLNPVAPKVDLSPVGIARDIVGETQADFADDMKQDSILAEALDGAFDRPLNEIIVPPVLLPVPHAEYIKARNAKDDSKIDRLDPHEEVAHGDILIIAAEENTGLTTALKWLTLEAANHLVGASPIYIPFESCKKRRAPLIDALETEARVRQLIQHRNDKLPPFILGLDNFSPYVDRISDAALQDIMSCGALLTIIGCVQGTEDEIFERLEKLGARPRIRYVGKLSSADVREYAKLASPTNHVKLADQVLLMLQAENLAKTPFTVSLLISVLLQGGKFAANASQTSILDDYIGLLLGRGDPHEDARFGLDQTAREALLGALAEAFVRSGVGGLSEIAVQGSFSDTFDKFGWNESTSEVLNSFIERRVLRRRGHHVEFARSSFLHVFAAKRATHSRDFRDYLLSRPLYYSSSLVDYAALFRHDADLLRQVSGLLEVDEEPRPHSSLFEPLALAKPRFADEGDEAQDRAVPMPADNNSEVVSEVEWRDAAFDSRDDADLPPFPTVDEDELPQAVRLIRTLELVSTVLRDSDQVEDLELKQVILEDLLHQWSAAMGVIHGDPTFLDFVKTLIEDLAIGKKDGSDADDILHEFGRAIPAAIVLNAVGTNLASRKLTRTLNKIVVDPPVPVSEELLVTACFFEYSLEEDGWPKRIAALLEERGNIWIIRNFLLQLLVFTYIEDEVSEQDSTDLLELCVQIIQQSINYSSGPESQEHRAYVLKDLEGQRLRSRTRRRYAAKAISAD
jgi:hypothetical protein